MLDHIRRIKSGGDLDSFKIDQIEKLEMDLRLLRTFVKYSHPLWPNSIVKITKKARRIVKMLWGDFVGIPYECNTNLDLKRLESQLLEVIDDVALKPHYVVEPSKHLPSQHSNPMSDDDEIMGFDIATKKIIRHLTRGTSELDVILTVGMGEQGKTIIARKIAGLEGGVEQEEDNDDCILDYDDDDDYDDEEATLVGIEELFGDLGEKNGTML
ncbi:hypothetical protein CQW23_25678 [Capsicum baccatum]|uniref:NB-ARC domain-containing protein n=1 Tax=Capsicum baccatum TaxID=33114 RepID=A0A2G2VLN7_CAPBA|nr:hypothetical protein CQW23_25678 [Capsicum baccatum]